ncbi:MAG: GNAT family N-acetyltransferase [Neisseria sp.]|nr:GNAT family N-acetyltransferase [Neisseria sp.]
MQTASTPFQKGKNMNITQKDDGKHGGFYGEENGQAAGEMTYTWAGDTMFIIDHTDVDEAFKGQGVGRKLVDAAVAFAREKELKVLPLCPFAKSVFDKDESIRDVLRG